jgi:hypothetical protein
MEEKWKPYIWSSSDRSCPSRIHQESAPFLARMIALYIEAPNGERIEQSEINQWCQNRFRELKT